MTAINKSGPVPTRMVLHTGSRRLEVVFSDQQSFDLPFEFLRVYSPSAEVRGHGPGQAVLQEGKREVSILELEPVGHYAVRPRFSDGHDSGLYTWDYIYHLGQHQEALWRDYLARLDQAGGSRDARELPAAAPRCGSAR